MEPNRIEFNPFQKRVIARHRQRMSASKQVFDAANSELNSFLMDVVLESGQDLKHTWEVLPDDSALIMKEPPAPAPDAS